MYVYTQWSMKSLFVHLSFPILLKDRIIASGELAQLARASALQAEGQGFESPILHYQNLVNGTVAQLVRAPL